MGKNKRKNKAKNKSLTSTAGGGGGGEKKKSSSPVPKGAGVSTQQEEVVVEEDNIMLPPTTTINNTNVALDDDNNANDAAGGGDNGSVSSVGTDRASNHKANSTHNLQQQQQQATTATSSSTQQISSPLPPVTMVAINDNNDNQPCMKLTEQNLALAASSANNNKRTAISAEGSPLKMMEVSSNLSRSSSESGGVTGGYLKNTNAVIQHKGNNKNSTAASGSGGSSSSGAANIMNNNFQPFGEDVSSLGSLKEEDDDALLISSAEEVGIAAATTDDEVGVGGAMQKTSRDLSYMALNVHPTLSSETPPKDNLSSSNHSNNKKKRVSSNHIPPSSPPSSSSEVPFPVELTSRTHHTPTRNIDIMHHHQGGGGNNSSSSHGGGGPSVNRLLPMGTGTAPSGVSGGIDRAGVRVNVDYSKLSSSQQQQQGGGRHPSLSITPNNLSGPLVPNNKTQQQQHSSPFPASPKPPSAIRVAHSPQINNNSNNNNINTTTRKATFINTSIVDQRASLTRQSSNASSVCTNASLTNTNNSRIRLGICAMDKKARSKPMSEILKRLDPVTFEAVYFGDEVILNESVDNWPICDVLIAFYSNGYPLEKAEQYVELRQPYLLNDLKMQRTLMDRRRVYDLLEESGIDVPRHVFMSRDGYVSTGTGDGKKDQLSSSLRGGGGGDIAYSGCMHDEPEIDEHDDHIEVNGVVINKPFVEKPVDADDHNIAIYYPSSAGGGCKKLFRKVGDRSSEFYPEINDVRRDGSFIYEEFIETQGTDVKMYTVGPDYGHAEARKSPTVDGKVERNADGKEVRFPVILTLREKEIARRIVLVFKQQVCGFDILRIQEGDSLVSYVCDVNGWSFVKNSRKYYDDCAQILTEHMLAALKPKSQVSFSALAPLLATMEDPVDNVSGGKPKKKKKKMQHKRGQSIADRVRTMLMGENNSSAEEGQHDDDDSVGAKEEENDKVSDLQYGSEDNASNGNSVGMTRGDTYEEPVDFITNPVRNLPDQLATEPASSASIVPSGASSLADTIDDLSQGPQVTTHQEELRCVITIVRHGDRTPKQKLKGNIHDEHFLQYFQNHTKKVKKDIKIKAKKDMIEFLETVNLVISDLEAGGTKKNREVLYKARHIRDVLQRWKFTGLNRKLQMKPRKWIEDDGKAKCSELQLIVKWGGDLTKLGEKQAVRLGNRLRNELYPSNKDGGILRLHSTFRHDLKIKTSDEGRVMKTAAAFAKGMLELEGDIPPILVSLVHKEKDSRHMLDPSGNKHVEQDLDRCKEMINLNMQRDVDYDKMTDEERESLVGPVRLSSLHRALKEIGNPRKTLIAIHSIIGQLVEQLDEMLGELLSGDEERIEGGEGLKGKEGHEALSGIKLYKGETLLELTERWKLLHNRLYDEEKDTFDLSRVPDVHDNVRFDMLHNPHLGLTETLQKLYVLAKSMADCVVPQEYGISIEEKRDIGSKMCHTLLEKINYDLAIARTDNQVDMRYLINMDYSADLPINSMGRRVRSRLYFTSESHLHSMLNVLRFPSIVPTPLSLSGQQILADASELCYLTQVVIRLFEDTQKPSDDPRRFRVEIMFSPGATATPLHMAELYREKDDSRFDTERLQKISIDGLTCAQVEEYFSEAIKEGKIHEDDHEGEKVPKEKKEKMKKEDKASKEELAEEPIQANTTDKDAEETNVDTSEISVGAAESISDKKEVPCGAIESRDPGCDGDSADHSQGSVTDSDIEKVTNNFRLSACAIALGVGCMYMMAKALKRR